MKLITLFTLLTFSLNAQTLITCPPTVSFQKDTLQEVYILLDAGTTDWVQIGNFEPNSNAKEGYTYEGWIPLNCQVSPVSKIVSIFYATQNRLNQFEGMLEMQAYYCVYSFRQSQKIKPEKK